MSCGFTVNTITVFTVSGDNESVTCAINAVSTLLAEGVTSPISQLEVCKGKSVAKIYTSNVTGSTLFSTDQVREILQASEVCYRIDDALEVINVSPLTSSDIRSRLYGNVKIRDLLTCGNVNYLQVPADEIIFSQNILTSCDLSTLTCYNPVPLNCACVPTVSTSTITLGAQGSTDSSVPFVTPAAPMLTLTLTGVVEGSSIYVALQMIAITGVTVTATVTDNVNGPLVLVNQYPPLTTPPTSSAEVAFIFYLDYASAGTHVLTANFDITSESSAMVAMEAGEFQNVAHPSLGPTSSNSGSGAITSTTPSTPFSASFTADENGEAGFLSLANQTSNSSSPPSINANSPSQPVGVEVVRLTVPPPLPTFGLGAAYEYPPAGVTIGNMVEISGNISASVNPRPPDAVNTWVAVIVGIRPLITVTPCPLTNCHFPVPNCHFQYPCNQLCCKK